MQSSTSSPSRKAGYGVRALTIILLLAPLVFFVIGVVAERWLETEGPNFESEAGLWVICDDAPSEECHPIRADCSCEDAHVPLGWNGAVPSCDHWRAVRGFAIMSILFAALALGCAIWVVGASANSLPKACKAALSSSITAAICGIFTTSLFATHKSKYWNDLIDPVTNTPIEWEYSYSFILITTGWVSCLAAAGLFTYISRKDGPLYKFVPLDDLSESTAIAAQPTV